MADPLARYEAAFGALDGEQEGVVRSGDDVAVRFVDPEGRRDRAGRLIEHDFVLSGAVAAGVHTVADGMAAIWPIVAEQYARDWDQPEPPTSDQQVGKPAE